MEVKITTSAQVAGLQKGDVIKRFPFNSAANCQDTFDSSRADVNTYEIRSVNKVRDIFSLVEINYRTLMLASPVDIGRLFIKGCDLIAEKNWWITT